MIYRLPIICMILCLTGCAGKSIPVQYYLLETRLAAPEIEQNNPVIAISEIQLADHLEQPGIVILIGDNNVHSAQYHLWGEDLRSAVPRILSRDLAQQCKCQVPLKPATEGNRISLNIDRFAPSDDGQAIFAGSYSITRPDGTHSARNFNYTADLAQDGYPHAVRQLRKLLSQLAEDIHKAIP